MGPNDEQFWNTRYREGTTGWDIGYVSTPLKEYIDGLEDTTTRILIPGAGNAWEGEYLYNNGFKNTYVLDISGEAVQLFRERVPEFPGDQVIQSDFFKHRERYELILEQTFFCAIPRERRHEYAHHVHKLLVPGGQLAGVLFATEFDKPGPPFGGSHEEYFSIFNPLFQIRTLAPCYNSIPPRQGNELFIHLEK